MSTWYFSILLKWVIWVYSVCTHILYICGVHLYIWCNFESLTSSNFFFYTYIHSGIPSYTKYIYQNADEKGIIYKGCIYVQICIANENLCALILQHNESTYNFLFFFIFFLHSKLNKCLRGDAKWNYILKWEIFYYTDLHNVYIMYISI